MRRIRVYLSIVFLLFSAFPAQSQTVLKHMRLGNSCESASYISTGPQAGTIVVEDGMQLVGFPNDGQGQLKTLFDFSKLGFTYQPSGFGYMSDEQLFVFTQPPLNSPSIDLTLSDTNGNPAGSVKFTWPPDFSDGMPYAEGIAWIPKNEQRYGGNFVFAAIQQQTGLASHFFVVDRSGNLVAEITPNVDTNNIFFYVTGLAYHNGHLIAGLVDQTLWELDLDGNVTAGPFTYGDLNDLEGVAFDTQTNQVAISGYGSSKLVLLDVNYNRLPDELSYLVGFGIGDVFDSVWDPDTQEYLIDSQAYAPESGLPAIAAISSDWSSGREIFPTINLNPIPTRLDYLPDTHGFALFHRSPPPRGFYYYDASGNQVGLDNLPSTWTPSSFSYIPTTRQYAIRKSTPANVIYIYDRDNLLGDPVRSIDLSPLGVTSITSFTFAHPEDPTGGQFVVVAVDKLLILDFTGKLIATINNAHHLYTIRSISSGPFAGDYVGTYTPNDELLILALPQRQSMPHR